MRSLVWGFKLLTDRPPADREYKLRIKQKQTTPGRFWRAKKGGQDLRGELTFGTRD